MVAKVSRNSRGIHVALKYEAISIADNCPISTRRGESVREMDREVRPTELVVPRLD